MLEHIATAIISAAGGSIGWVVTKYLVLPSKVEGLQEEVRYIKEKVDKLYDYLIQR